MYRPRYVSTPQPCPCNYFQPPLWSPLPRGCPTPPLARMRRMSRSVLVSIIALILSPLLLPAEQPAKDLTVTLGVQRAIAAARESIRKNQPGEAISTLEAELLNADGDAKYLALLHDAYAAQI